MRKKVGAAKAVEIGTDPLRMAISTGWRRYFHSTEFVICEFLMASGLDWEGLVASFY
jgi:putative component of toxin-antitoxin plasmid stabilization module